MNKKGFTLVELLGVIVILSIIMGIGVTTVNNITASIKEKALVTRVRGIEQAAVYWGQENQSLLNERCIINEIEYDKCKKIKVKELITPKAYYKTEETTADGKTTVLNDVTRKSMICDIVTVYRKNNRIYSVMVNTTDKKNEQKQIVDDKNSILSNRTDFNCTETIN